MYIILFFYFRLNFRHAARLRHRSRPTGRGSGAGFILFGSPHTGQIAQQVVQHSGGKPVLGVKIIAFAQRDIRQVLFLDGPQCRTAAGGFLHAAVAQALQDGIHLAVCYTIPDAAFGLLMAELFQNAVHGIICTFAWHVVLPFGMGFLFLRSRYLRRCMMLYIKIPAATLTL